LRCSPPALGIIVVKAVLIYGIARASGSANPDAQRLAVWLAQGGEFAFVLFTAAQARAILDVPTAQFLVLAVTLSMLIAPLAFSRTSECSSGGRSVKASPSSTPIDGPGNPVIIAGYGRYGQVVSRVLRMAGVSFTAIEKGLPAGGLRAPVRQQGVLRRRDEARAPRIGARPRREALRARDRRRRGVDQDGGARAQALPEPADPRPRAQSRAPCSACATSTSTPSSARRSCRASTPRDRHSCRSD
jgi:hypothetical protein